MDRNRDREEDEKPAQVAGGDSKLKKLAHILMPGLAPALAVAALLLALVAMIQNRADPVLVGQQAARIESMNASLSTARSDVESLKLILARDRSLRTEERKRFEERQLIVVQNISSLQSRLKVAPTLSEQLKKLETAPAVPHADNAASAPPLAAPVVVAPKLVVPTAVEKPAVVPAQPAAPVVPEKPAAPAVPAKPAAPAVLEKAAAPPQTPAKSDKAPATTAKTPATADKMPAQVKNLKDAIDQFNRK